MVEKNRDSPSNAGVNGSSPLQFGLGQSLFFVLDFCLVKIVDNGTGGPVPLGEMEGCYFIKMPCFLISFTSGSISLKSFGEYPTGSMRGSASKTFFQR